MPHNVFSTMHFVRPPSPAPIWTDHDALVADRESWGLFQRTGDGTYQIQRVDEHEKDWSDHEAYCFVRAKAEAGSEPHRKAIILHGLPYG